ncbi:Phosphoenolpyruvate synthase [Pelotomaculum sp. FP]|uniref:phosphoenolpyruvate synthase n=1 Tax=Pelotomaculum sp. FP TaxID=261474 RepID=UPI001064B34F|nr:phosphoenolpyruvate synthase [Pelotomaculum sp. FP]TEB15847.1 Phosphoenolpyruvate synthase [Pelotomaculum sp. FP]
MVEHNYVMYFDELNKSSLASAGGKGANLGELFHAPGIQVPAGFCITTAAYMDFVGKSPEFPKLLAALDRLDTGSVEEVHRAGEEIRLHLESLPVPAPIREEVTAAWRRTGAEYSYAVRSSATAEDLPGASFAGQQETFLNVQGQEQLLDCVRRCWASLFTDRAIIYRRRNRFSHGKVYLAVVVQRMVFPEVSGIMFTADPVSGSRRIVSIDASFGLGEALVSGLVSADLYQVSGGRLVKKQIARKLVAIYARPAGGTVQQDIPAEYQTRPALSEDSAVKLAGLGKRIEQHFGGPQDIEWCFAGGDMYILQSRPITTLYPLPAITDGKLHLFFSLGHAQMMTDAMKPLGISVLRTLAPFGKGGSRRAESPLLAEAGARLYVDLTSLLEHHLGRRLLPVLLSNVFDQSTSRAVADFLTREEFKNMPAQRGFIFSLLKKAFPTAINIFKNILYRNHSHVVAVINGQIAEQVRENKARLNSVSGADRLRLIQDLLSTLLPAAFSLIAQYLSVGVISIKLIERLSRQWLGNADELRSIGKSPVGNVTSEMGLALGDVADVVRLYPEVLEYLKGAGDEHFFSRLKGVTGGEEVQQALQEFLELYGMRGTGEIDVTRLRWRETPTQLVPAILSHIQSAAPQQHRTSFSTGKKEAERAAASLIARLRRTRWGFFKARIIARLIKVHRWLIVVREHPKYFIVQHLDIVKQAILAEAAVLAADGILEQPEDVFWLSLEEIINLIETRQPDLALIERRREEFLHNQKLVPPQVMTSDGEIITGRLFRENVPPGALTGTPVSAGVVEGRARVILKLEEANMRKGEILVTPFTDPGWTPLFPLAAGLVTEVGGLMTHGAVVAREYGIPAVVGVDSATSVIKDGQRIRIDGHQGFIEIL